MKAIDILDEQMDDKIKAIENMWKSTERDTLYLHEITKSRRITDVLEELKGVYGNLNYLHCIIESLEALKTLKYAITKKASK